MAVHSSVGKCYFFVLAFVTVVFVSNEAVNTTCQVYPSEYVIYSIGSTRPNYVGSDNCVYQHGPYHGTYYTHCDGTPLRLADSQLGSEQYNSSDYYVWDNVTDYGELVFTFPTRVNLTTITLHYYSDNIRGFGFPCLEFTALREYRVFGGSVYEGTTIEAPRPVPPDGESTGPKSISVNHVNRTTKYIMMSIVRCNLQPVTFALSEVEFFTCDQTASTAHTDPSSLIWLLMVIIVVNFVNGTFTIDDYVTGVYNKQADATDTSGNTLQYKTELQ